MSKTFQQKLCEMEGTECGTNNLDFTFESEHKIHKYQAIFDYDIEVRFLGPGEEHKETLACVKGKLEVCALTEGNEKCTPN